MDDMYAVVLRYESGPPDRLFLLNEEPYGDVVPFWSVEEARKAAEQAAEEAATPGIEWRLFKLVEVPQ